jgi:glucokinase
MQNQYLCGFDLGGTKMLSVVLDNENQIVSRKRRKTKGNDGPTAIVERICELVRETFEDAGLPIDQMVSLGVGCPGPVNMDKGVVNVAVNLGWKNVPLAAMLEEKLRCPVSVLNDVDAGVYGEYSLGAGQGAQSVVGIFPGTGIGGGFVYEGKILRSKRSSVMEIGHTKISSSNRNSGFEMTGTLESEASRLAIAAECAKLAYRGEAPYLFKQVGTDLSKIRSKVLAESIREGDKAVENIVRRAAQMVGYGVVNVVHMLCPEVIVLGGGLVEALQDIYMEEVNKTAKKNILQCYSGMFEIRMAKLGDDAGAMGAALWGALKKGMPITVAESASNSDSGLTLPS